MHSLPRFARRRGSFGSAGLRGVPARCCGLTPLTEISPPRRVLLGFSHSGRWPGIRTRTRRRTRMQALIAIAAVALMVWWLSLRTHPYTACRRCKGRGCASATRSRARRPSWSSTRAAWCGRPCWAGGRRRPGRLARNSSASRRKTLAGPDPASTIATLSLARPEMTCGGR